MCMYLYIYIYVCIYVCIHYVSTCACICVIFSLWFIILYHEAWKRSPAIAFVSEVPRAGECFGEEPEPGTAHGQKKTEAIWKQNGDPQSSLDLQIKCYYINVQDMVGLHVPRLILSWSLRRFNWFIRALLQPQVWKVQLSCRKWWGLRGLRIDMPFSQ